MKKLILLTILSTFLYADFIGLNNGARSLGMGNAFVALSDEPTAIFYNPAGLARVNKFSLITSRQELYGIEDLYSDMIAISFPTPYFRTGVAIQQLNLLNTYSEQIIYVSAAGIFIRNNIPVRFGASLKYESAKVKRYEGTDAPSNFDIDIGVIIDFNENLFFGYSGKHLLEPTFKFIEIEDKIEIQHSIGLCYNWRNSVNFLVDHRFGERLSQWHFGGEIWFYDVFASRIGILDDKLTFGFGLRAKQWIIDGAILAHEDLGSSYRVSLGFKLGMNDE
jgi:hypothetical protein